MRIVVTLHSSFVLELLVLGRHLTFGPCLSAPYWPLMRCIICCYSQDASSQAAKQVNLEAEAEKLETVYNTQLLGGGTIEEAAKDGSKDDTPGALFMSSALARLIYSIKGCLRVTASECRPSTDVFYQVTTNGLDPMVRRFISEALLLAQDVPASISPTNSTR